MNPVAHFPERRRNGSSVRSAIFVVRRTIVCPKLRRSGIGRMMSPLWGLDCFGNVGFYKDAASTRLTHRPPREILKALGQLEAEIQQGMKELEGMLRCVCVRHDYRGPSGRWDLGVAYPGRCPGLRD